MFEVIHEDGSSGARVGLLKTKHGEVKTPAFMPVATKGGVKTLDPQEVVEVGTQAIISNAFLLYLKPGVDVIREAGGLHEFSGFSDTVIFTDSGGFQMLRESFFEGVSKKGVTFRSPFDDSKHVFTPEKCMEVQMALGSDVAMVLDDCPPYDANYDRVKKSTERTVEWAKRCIDAHGGDQFLFCIIQGGHFKDLRRDNTEALGGLGFDGYGIGGLSIGEPLDEMFDTLRYSVPLIPRDKPRYLMGVGSPVELLESVGLGVDIFDSAFPTRNARHNTVYTYGGKYNISKGRFKGDYGPLEEGCGCYACQNFSRAYVSHLMRVHEALGMRLVTIHNLYFIHDLLEKAREAMVKDGLEEFKLEFERDYSKRADL
ncbi:MAG: tRNA guanosine(34) transglycosylase Tgt [Candidatus Hydrothermarchaeales archaeon]